MFWLERGALLAASVFLAAVAGPVVAEEAGALAPKWTRICETDKATKLESCAVVLEIRAETGQLVASAALRQAETGSEKASLLIALPTGLLLKPGLTVTIDDREAVPVNYEVCGTDACYGRLAIDADFIAALKNGKQLVVGAFSQQARPMAFPMPLAGFTAAYDGAGISPEARQAELEKALADSAAKARERLGGGEKATPPAPQ